MAEAQRTMSCMEVWGGNQPADRGVVMPGLTAFVYSRPVGGEAGGDVHYVSSCATGRITRMLVADVAGHGAQVAQSADHLRNLMRRYINYLDQSSFVRALNEKFGTLEREGRFATAISLTYWAPTRVMTLCNAGHPRPLFYDSRAGDWGALDAECAPLAGALAAYGAPDGVAHGASAPPAAPAALLQPTNLPLGVAHSIEYEQFYRRLDRHDLLLLYTDSAIEARSPAGDELGEAGLLDLVRSLDPTRPERLVGGVINGLRQHTRSDEPADDLTLLLLGHNDVRPRSGPRALLEASGRVAREVAASIGRKPIPWPDWRLETFGGIVSKRLNERWGGRPEE
jgi:sigma-B regulation protein RsbU (phosphoserine phosphatase)